VRDLLTHTSGLPAWKPLYESGAADLDGAVETILRLPPEAAPGERYAYSCLGFVLLARIVEIVSGRRLDAFAADQVFAPLGLRDTCFLPDPSLRPRIAPTKTVEQDPGGAAAGDAGAELVGVVHDGNARAIGGVSGNAGLFGTAEDVARFGEAMRQNGLCAGGRARLFAAPTAARVLTNQVRAEVGGAHTLLFFAQNNGLCPAGDLLSPRTVGHSGFTGTVLTIDPEYDLTVALLTNRVLTDPGGTRWLSARRRFLNALAASLT
jgi:CubicO group peptidase (beta-lactamase class C family)